jgi:hypothetical protein
MASGKNHGSYKNYLTFKNIQENDIFAEASQLPYFKFSRKLTRKSVHIIAKFASCTSFQENLLEKGVQIHENVAEK